MKNAVVVFLTALLLGPVPALAEICSDPDPLACDPIAFFTKANSAPDIVIGPGPPDVTFYSTQNFLATSTAGPWNLNHLEFQNNSGITLTDLVFSFSGVLDMTGLAIPPLFSCPEGGAAGVNSAGWFELPCPVIESVTRVGTTRDYVVSGSFTLEAGTLAGWGNSTLNTNTLRIALGGGGSGNWGAAASGGDLDHLVTWHMTSSQLPASPIPEPSSIVLGLTVAGLAALMYRRKRQLG